MKTIWDEASIEVSAETKLKISAYKSRAKSKGIKYKIHPKEFAYQIKRPCYVCEVECAGGLDRIDNSEGYVVGNIYPCCFDCNRMKSNKTKQEFLDYIKRLNPNHNLLSGFNALLDQKKYAKKVRSVRRLMTKLLTECSPLND